jgi:chemotaxis protein MotB
MNARRTRRRKHPPHTASHERWLVSYADFITLLFAFFTTMYAISTVDARKLTSMVDSMQEAFDTQGVPLPAQRSAAPRAPAPVEAAARTTEMRERALAQLLRDRLDGRAVDVEIDHRGIVVSMREAGSFPTGSADLSAAARTVLSELAETLGAETTMTLRVEGHTDDVPIQTGKFASNWDLSTARATSVVTYLVQQVGVAPQRLSAAGYGEFHPRVANAGDADRARNRRVDIVILNEETAAAEEPGQGSPRRTVVPPTSPSTMPSGRAFAG